MPQHSPETSPVAGAVLDSCGSATTIVYACAAACGNGHTTPGVDRLAAHSGDLPLGPEGEEAITCRTLSIAAS